MKNNLKYFLLFVLFSNISFALEINESLRLDGYTNITGLFSNKENSDSFQINGGIQGRYQISDNISFTGHIYFEEANESNNLRDYEEDIKWLYADYYLGEESTLRLGKFQFPIFTSSEIGTIGYSRTWTENPINNYGAFGYENFTGAELLKNFYYDDFDYSLQLSYGQSENDLPSLNNNNNITGKADSIGGITLKSSNNWLMLNIGYMRALSEVSINTQINFDTQVNINFDMYAIEMQSDLDNFSIKAGYITAYLNSIFPNEQRYYTSIEYNHNDLTPYIYYANEKLDFKQNEQSDLLQTDFNEIKKYSTGIRYDFNKNIAFKLSYTKQIKTNKYNNNTEDQNKGEVFKGAINVLF